MRTDKLTGPALDWAVAKALGLAASWWHDYKLGYPVSSSTDWRQGGPIIEREKINLYTTPCPEPWKATITPDEDQPHYYFRLYGPTPLIAAMRVYVARKLGDEIEIPKELEATIG